MIDLTQTLLDRRGVTTEVEKRVVEDGQYVIDEFHKQKTEKIEATLGDLLANALLRDYGIAEEEAILKHFNLFKKVEGAKDLEVSEEELTLLKGVVCKAYDTYFAGTILSLLN